MTVNTTTARSKYDVAIAMVWVEDGEETGRQHQRGLRVRPCRTARPWQSRSRWSSSSGEADVVVPQNVSAAVNYECFECITAAVAKQLVVTVDGPVSDEAWPAPGHLG